MRISRNDINLFLLFSLPFLIGSSLPAQRAATVRMLDETVNIRIDANYKANINVLFHFSGTAHYAPDLVFPETHWFRLENFTAKWHAKPMPIQRMPRLTNRKYEIAGHYYESLFRYAAGTSVAGTATHEISYDFNMPFLDDQKYAAVTGRYGEYILKTGVPWRGTIGNVTVNIELSDCTRLVVVYDGYIGRCISSSLWQFTAKNIEPKKNIRFVIVER